MLAEIDETKEAKQKRIKKGQKAHKYKVDDIYRIEIDDYDDDEVKEMTNFGRTNGKKSRKESDGVGVTVDNNDVDADGDDDHDDEKHLVINDGVHVDNNNNNNNSGTSNSNIVWLAYWPWAGWLLGAVVAALPWLLVVFFPTTVSVWVVIILFFAIGLGIAAYNDIVHVSMDAGGGLVEVRKRSLWRMLRGQTLHEKFTFDDVRRIDVRWLGEKALRKNIRLGRETICNSPRTAIQSSTVLVVCVSARSAFQEATVRRHRERQQRRAASSSSSPSSPSSDIKCRRPLSNKRGAVLPTSLTERQRDLRVSRNAPSASALVAITVREVQDFVGLERWAVQGLEQWADIMRETLNVAKIVPAQRPLHEDAF
jgi:hypothetical protein